LLEKPRETGQRPIDEVARGDQQVRVLLPHDLKHARKPFPADDRAEVHIGDLADPQALHMRRQPVRLDHDALRPDVERLAEPPGRHRDRQGERDEESGLRPRDDGGKIPARDKTRQRRQSAVQIRRQQRHDQKEQEPQPEEAAPGNGPCGLLGPLSLEDAACNGGQDHGRHAERNGHGRAGTEGKSGPGLQEDIAVHEAEDEEKDCKKKRHRIPSRLLRDGPAARRLRRAFSAST